MSYRIVGKTGKGTKLLPCTRSTDPGNNNRKILEFALQRDAALDTGHQIIGKDSDFTGYESIFAKLYPKGPGSIYKRNHSLRAVWLDEWCCFSNTKLMPQRGKRNKNTSFLIFSFSFRLNTYPFPVDCYFYLFSSIGNERMAKNAMDTALDALSRCENMTYLGFLPENRVVWRDYRCNPLTARSLGDFVRQCESSPSRTLVLEIDVLGICGHFQYGMSFDHFGELTKNCGDKVELCVLADSALWGYLSADKWRASARVKRIRCMEPFNDDFFRFFPRLRSLTHLSICEHLSEENQVKVWDVVRDHESLRSLSLPVYERNDYTVVSSVIKRKHDLSIVRFDHGQEDFDDDFLPLLVANRIRTKLNANPISSADILLKGLCDLSRCASERRDTLTPTYELLREKFDALLSIMKGSIPSLMSQPGKKRRLV